MYRFVNSFFGKVAQCRMLGENKCNLFWGDGEVTRRNVPVILISEDKRDLRTFHLGK